MPPRLEAAPRRRRRAAPPKPVARSPVFGPLSSSPFKPAVKAARANVRKAEQQVSGRTVPIARIPHGPLTPQTRRALIAHQETAIKHEVARASGSSTIGAGNVAAGAQRAREIEQARSLGDRASRTALNQLKGAQRRERKLSDIAAGSIIARTVKEAKGRTDFEQMGRLARQPPPGSNAGEYRGTTFRTQHSNGNLSKTLGISKIPLLGGAAKTTGDALEFAARPLHATAGAVREVNRGGSLGDVVSEAGRGLSGKQKVTFGDVLRERGASGAVATIGGLAGDIAFDPINYLSLGASVPASAGREATTQGLRVGLRTMGGRHTLDLPLVTRATSAAADTKLARDVRSAVRDSAPVQAAGRAFVPGFRPRGVAPEEWQKAIDLERRSRGETNTARRYAEQRGKAYHGALKDHPGGAEQVIAAIERAPKDPAAAQELRTTVRALEAQAATENPSADVLAALDTAREHLAALPTHSIHSLPADLKDVALQARKELHVTGKAEQQMGLLPKLRTQYIPHQWVAETTASSQGARAGRKISSTRNEYAARRKLEGSIAELNAKAEADNLPPIFSNDLPSLMAHRLAKSGGMQAAERFRTGLVDQGVARTVTGDAAKALKSDRDMFYSLSKSGVTPIVDRHGLPDAVAAQKAIKDGERVVVMNKMIGDRYQPTRLMANKSDPLSEPSLGAAFDRFVSGMKTVFTVGNFPAYDLRNLTGDLFNAYLADTHAKDLIDSFKAISWVESARRASLTSLENAGPTRDFVISLGKNRSAKASELLARAEKAGAMNTGHVAGQLHEVERAPTGGIRTKFSRRGVPDKFAHPVDFMRGIGEFRENAVRFGTWLGAVRRGMSDDEAARWANLHHFDYTELTGAERTVLRRVFPFWTFVSRNTQLQAKKFLTNPGKYANYEAFREEQAKNAGLPDNWESKLQPYQRRGGGFPFRLPGSKTTNMAYPALPLTDLARPAAALSGDGRSLFDLTLMNVNPIIKSPLEFGLNYSTFFKQPIYRTTDAPDARHWVPAPPQLAKVPGVREALGMRLLPDKRQGGKKVWQWTAKADYLLRQSPQSNFAISALTPTTSSHGQGPGMAWASQLSGVKIGPYDKGTNDLRAAQQHLRELTKTQRDMNDQPDDSPQGHNSPAYRQLTAEMNATKKKVEALKKKQGYAPPRKRPASKRVSGSYGSGGGGSVYGSGGSQSVYGSGSSGSLYGG